MLRFLGERNPEIRGSLLFCETRFADSYQAQDCLEHAVREKEASERISSVFGTIKQKTKAIRK